MINMCAAKRSLLHTGCRKDPKFNLAFIKEKKNDKTRNNCIPTKLPQSDCRI